MRDRVAAGVLLERQPRLDVEYVERLSGEGTLDRVPAGRLAQAQPDFARPRGAGPLEVDGRGAPLLVPDDALAVDAREAAHRVDDADGDALARDLEREQAAFVGRGGQPRRGEDGNRIRGLARPDPRRDRVRERVPDARPVDPGSADADPVGDPARHVRSSMVTAPVSPVPASAPRSIRRVSGSIAIPASRPPRSLTRQRVAERDADEPPRRRLDLGEESTGPPVTRARRRRAEGRCAPARREPPPARRANGGLVLRQPFRCTAPPAGGRAT